MPRPKRFKKYIGRAYQSLLEAIDEGISSDDDTVASNAEILPAVTDETPNHTNSARSTMPASPALIDELKFKSRALLEKIEIRSKFIQSRDIISPVKVKEFIEVELQKIDRATDIATLSKINTILKRKFKKIELEYKVDKKLKYISKFKDSGEFVKEQKAILDNLTTDQYYNKAALKLKLSEYSEYLKNKTLSLLETIKDLYEKNGKDTDELSAIETAIDTMSDKYLVRTGKDLQRIITHLNPSVEAGAEIAARDYSRFFIRETLKIKGEESPKAKDDEFPTPPENTSGNYPK